jgi:endonuclease G, mitochondrial
MRSFYHKYVTNLLYNLAITTLQAITDRPRSSNFSDSCHAQSFSASVFPQAASIIARPDFFMEQCMTSVTFDIPLKINVSLGEATPPSFNVTRTDLTLEGLERVEIDKNYVNRQGYQADFLGASVSLPVLNLDQIKNAAKNIAAVAGQDNTVLHYHHFSIVMNRRRQLAYYTAVNIDGAMSKNPERKGDKWYFDPRIAESEQIGGDLYARNQLDRGHLVRRLDPAWGDNKEALWANNDTFHFTNCSPQHARFNQNSATWQGIENYLLHQLAQEGRRRLNIFTGPVLTEVDPIYRGVRLPLHFWKIAVYNDTNANLVAAAYLLSQEDLVKNVEGLEAFKPNTFQVKVDEIMERTELDFSHLLAFQVDLGRSSQLERSPMGDERILLKTLADLVM